MAIWLTMRGWPAEMDEQGMTLRNGTRVSWSEFTRIRKINVIMDGRQVSERYDLRSPRGKVSIVPSRLDQGEDVARYVWERLPKAVIDEATAV